VAALFHDVGKTPHPLYFGENQRERVDPHASLPPAESARIIKQHVADGVELAQKHRLPRAVVDVIQQHHGTTLVRYFYQRAVEQSRPPFAGRTGAGTKAPGADAIPPGSSPAPFSLLPTPTALPSEAAFRYDDPRPQFKESAIISLADGVEAAARSLREVRSEQLHALINRIVDDRIADGQPDESPVTLEEITRIKNSFQFTLLNMLHARVAYPQLEDSTTPAGEAGGAT